MYPAETTVSYMTDYSRVTPAFLRELEGIVGPKGISVLGEDLVKHSKDESLEPPHTPEVIVYPLSTGEISSVMKLASIHNIPVTPQGSRTGLSGGAHPVYGGIALSLERMTKILEIDEGNLMAVVEPGVLIMDLHAETEKRGLLYPPDPGQESGSLGGNISTNAGGVKGMKYGVTRDFVQELEVVLPSGEVLTIGGRHVKNSTGYELIDLFVGSEGTLGVVSKATLRLVPKPKNTAIIYVPFNSARAAAKTVSEIVSRKVVPYALEYVPRHAILTAERFLERTLPDHNHLAYLIVGVDGNSENEIDRQLDIVGEVCIEMGGADAYLADTPSQQQQLWEARKCLFEAYKAFYEIDEVDACVPRSRFPDYVEGAEKISERLGILISTIGHAGDGNAHSIIAREQVENRDAWLKKLDVAIEELIELSLGLGGTISGEHGVGYAKKKYLVRKVGDTQLNLMKVIKRGFDPQNILNPGKVIDV
jgi:glycolate oxidase